MAIIPPCTSPAPPDRGPLTQERARGLANRTVTQQSPDHSCHAVREGDHSLLRGLALLEAPQPVVDWPVTTACRDDTHGAQIRNSDHQFGIYRWPPVLLQSMANGVSRLRLRAGRKSDTDLFIRYGPRVAARSWFLFQRGTNGSSMAPPTAASAEAALWDRMRSGAP